MKTPATEHEILTLVSQRYPGYTQMDVQYGLAISVTVSCPGLIGRRFSGDREWTRGDWERYLVMAR